MPASCFISPFPFTPAFSSLFSADFCFLTVCVLPCSGLPSFVTATPGSVCPRCPLVPPVTQSTSPCALATGRFPLFVHFPVDRSQRLDALLKPLLPPLVAASTRPEGGTARGRSPQRRHGSWSFAPSPCSPFPTFPFLSLLVALSSPVALAVLSRLPWFARTRDRVVSVQVTLGAARAQTCVRKKECGGRRMRERETETSAGAGKKMRSNRRSAKSDRRATPREGGKGGGHRVCRRWVAMHGRRGGERDGSDRARERALGADSRGGDAPDALRGGHGQARERRTRCRREERSDRVPKATRRGGIEARCAWGTVGARSVRERQRSLGAKGKQGACVRAMQVSTRRVDAGPSYTDCVEKSGKRGTQQTREWGRSSPVLF